MRPWVVPLLLTMGCYRSVEPGAPSCPRATEPACYETHGCDVPAPVEPVCEGAIWSCPAGSRTRPVGFDDVRCLPFEGALREVFEAPVSVPVGDSCAWLLPTAISSRGERFENALVPLDDVHRCADLTLDGVHLDALTVAPGLAVDFVGVQQAFRGGDGAARFVARGWVWDASAPFGVRGVGTGFGRVDAVTGALSLDGPFVFDEASDAGDAALADGGFVYAYGCPGTPNFLIEDCFVWRAPELRADDPAAYVPWNGRDFAPGTPSRVFGSGPHRGPVVRDPRGGGFLHAFIAGFGDGIDVAVGPRPEGPFGEPRRLVDCDLPADDPDAYCAGPGVYLELVDPAHPADVVVGYSVGSLAPDAEARRRAHPDRYTARVARVRLPG